MTIDELVSTLTVEEKEYHKDLIEECRRREAAIKEAREKSLKGIEIIANDLLGEVGEFIFYRIANKKSLGRGKA